MSRILLCWELGGSLGHLVPLQQVAEYYLQQGHEVWLASKYTHSVADVFYDTPVKLLQAPRLPGMQGDKLKTARSFSELLYNVGYGDKAGLYGAVTGWQTLIRLVQPDLILADFSPTVFLACRGKPVSVIAIGSSFSIPPPDTRDSVFFDNPQAEQIAHQAEALVVSTVREVCNQLNIPGIDAIYDLFDSAQSYIFRLYKELDHYQRPERQMRKIAYIGPPSLEFNRPADFPDYPGPKIFCYLKPSASVPMLLKTLQQLECSAVVVTSGIPYDVVNQHRAAHIRYTSHPVNIQDVLDQASLGIMNANMNTMGQFLKQGTPLALVPLTVEQYIVAKRAEALTVGVILNLDSVQTTIQGLNKSLSQVCRQHAADFARKYKRFDPKQSLVNALSDLAK